MKSLPPLAIRLLSAMICLLAGGSATGLASPPAAATVLTRNDAGKTFSFDPGTDFRVELSSNPIVGYTWHLAKLDSDVVKATKSGYVQNTGPLEGVGAGGKDAFAFKAMKKGDVTIRLSIHMPKEGKREAVDEQVEYKIIVR